MAHTTTTATSSHHPNHPTRKYRLRNSPPSRLRQSHKQPLTVSPPASRGVLLPLPPNLRRLPSRLALFGAVMPPLDTAQVGSKRKRAFSTNENAHAQGRSSRKVKRRRGYKEPDSEPSDMDLDESEHPPWLPTDEDEEHDGHMNRDHYQLNTAPPHQLHRLRKEQLVRLFLLVDVSGSSTEHLTKHELVDAIIAARHDGLQLQSSSPHAGPPSSPSSTGAGDDDDTDGECLRPISKLDTHSVARSLSLGCIITKKSTRFEQLQKASVKRRRTSNGACTSGSVSHSHSSSTTQSRRSSPTAISSPLVTRLRTRTVSFHFGGGDTKKSFIKGRRQVDSDEEDEDGVTEATPSPRRLRSKIGSMDPHDNRRITPMRKAKGRVGSLKESDDEEKDELKDDDERPDDDTEQDEDAVEEADEEVDELAPSLSPSPTPMRRRTRAQTQISSRVMYDLRRSRTAPELLTPRVDPRRLRRMRTQASGTPSDGDDEDTDGEDHGSESDEDSTAPEEDATDGVEMEVEVEPRRLRNGKIVGDEEEVVEQTSEMDEEEQDGEGEGGEDGEGDVEEDDADAASVDLEADSMSSRSDASGGDASFDEDVDEDGGEEGAEVDIEEDLQDATAKTLVRRRRDHLIKLCQSRGIDAEGTKPQLVEALIQWRDNQSSSPPSSGATARPPSTTRTARRSGQRHARAHTPVLLRLDRVQAADPDTPHPESNTAVQTQSDDGVLLDLEGLGLEDSVIPPSKLSKVEKIGSGGFKDVFVGKLGGKKVAIAEFRGQLTEMDIKELKLLSRFDHPNVVKFLGVSIPENPKETPMIVSELCSNGDLFDYVRNVPPPHVNKMLCLMLDIARGLKYLHDHKPSVIHRDCKSSNILITSRVSAKIADFGLAKVKQSTRSMVRSLVGTVNWQAPELWHAHPKYNYKVDVFSCAMVFWEILQWHIKEKKFPWEGMNEHAIYEVVGAKQQRPSVAGLAKQWCPEIVELMEHMWAHDHKDRPDMTYVVEQLEALKDAHAPPRTHAKAR